MTLVLNAIWDKVKIVGELIQVYIAQSVAM